MIAVKIYDTSMNLKVVLENAFNVGYEQRLNEVGMAHFSLPGNDPKNTECLEFRFVEIYDSGELIDTYRIMPNTLNKNQDSFIINYECEHVLATLLDDILFQYNQTTNLSPTNTINKVLSAQSTVRWQLGTVNFTASFSYKWENENLLSALFSIPKAYNLSYQFTWNTTTSPWTLNLTSPSTTPSSFIRYRKNLLGISKETDPRFLITKLYALGYGEGVNQLTIESVNGGQAYITASTTAYGTISGVFTDKTEENATTLLAKAQTKLAEASTPRVTYSIAGADISSITDNSIDQFRIGEYVQVDDSETGLSFSAQVVSVTKPNITEEPGNVQLEISNKVQDLASDGTDLRRRQLINDLYSQGAVNIDSNDYQDNCDSTHPATVRFYLPSETVRVNKCLLSFESDQFRAYETGAEAGGVHSHLMFANIGGTWDDPLESVANTTDIGGLSAGHTHTFNDKIHAMCTSQCRKSSASADFHNIGIALNCVDAEDLWTYQDSDTHTHAITYGIYEFSASATSVTVKIDTATVTAITSTSITDFDMIPYLTLDGDGKITRGAWHTVEITPNNLSRISASVIKQIFVQSRGGGDF